MRAGAEHTPVAVLPQDASRPVGRAAATATKFIRTYSKRVGSAGTGLDTAAALEEAALPAEEVGQLVEIPFMAPLK